MAIKKIGETFYPAVASVGADGEVISPSAVPGLEIPPHDYIGMTYTGSNLTGVVYRSGGVGGTIVATLTLVYDGSGNLTSVTKS